MKKLPLLYLLFLLSNSAKTYSQTSSVQELMNRYSLDSQLIISWKKDVNGCRQHPVLIDSIKNIVGKKMADFFVLFGEPDVLTNEYGEKTVIKDTALCTYKSVGNCKLPQDKNISVGEMSILFIKGELKNISYTIID